MIIPIINPITANCKDTDDAINCETVSNWPTEISLISSAISIFFENPKLKLVDLSSSF